MDEMRSLPSLFSPKRSRLKANIEEARLSSLVPATRSDPWLMTWVVKRKRKLRWKSEIGAPMDGASPIPSVSISRRRQFGNGASAQ